MFLLQHADYGSYAAAGYNQMPYTNAYSYYPYMSTAGVASLGSTPSTTVPASQTYQLMPTVSIGASPSHFLTLPIHHS